MKRIWPFWGQEERKSGTPLVALSGLLSARWGGRDAAALARDGYVANAVAYRCVRMVAEAAASVPLRTANRDLAALLKRPQAELSGRALLEGAYTHLQLGGDAYIEAIALSEGEAPRGLFLLRPDTVRGLNDERGWAEGYAVKERHRERVIRREEDGWSPVLHIRTFNPLDDAKGLPPLGAARRALDLHNASADWAKALLDNSAKPSGALVYGKDGARMSDEQFDRLKSELSDGYSGAANAGRPLLLEGGLDWKPMSLSPAEMDFMQARNGAAREIALALGVPPMLLGIPGDNNYANYREANIAFWRLTVLPMAARMVEALEVWLGPRFGEADIRCDLEGVPALSAERDGLWKRLEAASFATKEEKRKIAGLEE